MSAEPMSPERLAAAREVVASGMPMANERAADLLAEVDRLRSDPVRQLATELPADVTASITVHINGGSTSVRWTAIGWDETSVDTYGNAASIPDAITAMRDVLDLGALSGEHPGADA